MSLRPETCLRSQRPVRTWMRTHVSQPLAQDSSTILQGFSMAVEQMHLTLAEESFLRTYFFNSFSFFLKYQFIGVRMIFDLKLIFAGPAALPKTVYFLWSFPGN